MTTKMCEIRAVRVADHWVGCCSNWICNFIYYRIVPLVKLFAYIHTLPLITFRLLKFILHMNRLNKAHKHALKWRYRLVTRRLCISPCSLWISLLCSYLDPNDWLLKFVGHVWPIPLNWFSVLLDVRSYWTCRNFTFKLIAHTIIYSH